MTAGRHQETQKSLCFWHILALGKGLRGTGPVKKIHQITRSIRRGPTAASDAIRSPLFSVPDSVALIRLAVEVGVLWILRTLLGQGNRQPTACSDPFRPGATRDSPRCQLGFIRPWQSILWILRTGLGMFNSCCPSIHQCHPLTPVVVRSRRIGKSERN
jgi:hypothetical protein